MEMATLETKVSIEVSASFRISQPCGLVSRLCYWSDFDYYVELPPPLCAKINKLKQHWLLCKAYSVVR